MKVLKLLLLVPMLTMGYANAMDSPVTKSLRGVKVADDNDHRELGKKKAKCGCEACTDAILNKMVTDIGGTYSCGARIDYVVSLGQSEEEACELVAGIEFPDGCGPQCDPTSCEQVAPQTRSSGSSTCGCDACTDSVQSRIVSDSAGDYSCGGRISWLVSNIGMSETDACRRVAGEFPEDSKCGPCDPDNCPTTNTQTYCGCQGCTDSVWNTMTSVYTCGERITYLLNGGTSEYDACRQVAGFEWGNVCGACDPEKCNAGGGGGGGGDGGGDSTETDGSVAPNNACGCKECTQQVWDRDADGYTCGGRITYVMGQGKSQEEACQQVAGAEFFETCGECDPQRCGLRTGEEQDQGPPGSLLWSDEFDGSSIDESMWNYDLGNSGWGNRELQDYTRNNARVENGDLVIKVERTGNYISSARLNTIGKYSFLYGEVEAMIKLPNLANGLWPAFWLLGANFREVGWPRCGEIDIFEMGINGAIGAGTVNRYVGSHAHWDVDGNYAGWGESITMPSNLNDGQYHKFTMSWTPNTISTTIDDRPIWNFDISNPDGFSGHEFHKPQSFIVNVAVGGTYTGILDVNGISANFPAELRVQYIRVRRNEHTVG